jgi:probable HAF family extracellular repeat protein
VAQKHRLLYTNLDEPSAIGQTYAIGINNAGDIVGLANNVPDAHAFIYKNGTYTRLSDPLPGAFGTEPLGINNLGQISGSYTYKNASHGFLYANGIFSTLDYPSSPHTEGGGLNDRGQIVGSYSANNTSQAFLACFVRSTAGNPMAC